MRKVDYSSDDYLTIVQGNHDLITLAPLLDLEN